MVKHQMKTTVLKAISHALGVSFTIALNEDLGSKLKKISKFKIEGNSFLRNHIYIV